MSGAAFLEKINDIDADLLAAAERQPARKKQSRARWLLPAAACLVLLGVTVYAVSNIFSVKKWYTFDESGYSISFELTGVREGELKGDIREAPERIREQVAAYQVWSSSLPTVYHKSCESAKAAAEYVGYDGLVVPHFPYAESETQISVLGGRNGRINMVRIESYNLQEDIRAQAISLIYTTAAEADENGRKLDHAITERLDYSWSEFTTENGYLCQTVRDTPMASGYMGLDGYIVKDKVLYWLHLAFKENDAERAEEMLRAWAEAF